MIAPERPVVPLGLTEDMGDMRDMGGGWNMRALRQTEESNS